MKIESHTVPQLSEKMRLSDYARGIFKTIPSRKGMKKAIDKGLVMLDGTIAHTADLVSEGRIIELLENPHEKRPSIDLKLKVLFEDAHLAVVYKPAGIEVSGNKKWTVENALSSNLEPSTETDALTYPEPIHRLDYPTSGALLVGKTSRAVIGLNRLFEDRQIEKVYHAITIGEMTKKGTIEIPVDGKASQSEFEVLRTLGSERFGSLNLVRLNPKTGRRHQLRKHLSEMGNPILGDRDYGIEGLILSGKGLYLHASALRFAHPITGQIADIESPLPKKFLKLFR